MAFQHLSGLVAALFLGVVVVNTTSAADLNDPDPEPVGGMHDSQLGKFSHWSAVARQSVDRISIEYAICNFDKTPLIYDWRSPGISVGPGGRLPIGKCHIAERTAPSFELDNDAPILFTQAGRSHLASAYVSKLASAPNWLPPVVANRLRSFFVSKTDAPTLADLNILQSRSGSMLRHRITWRPPMVSVGIAADAFGGMPLEKVVGSIREAGYDAVSAPLAKMLGSSSLSSIPKERHEKPIITIRRNSKSPDVLEFSIEIAVKSVGQSHVTLINAETGELITDFETVTFRP